MPHKWATKFKLEGFRSTSTCFFCVLLQMENFCTELAIFFSIKLCVAGFKKIYNNEQDEFHVDSTNLIEQACEPPVRGRKQISCDTACSCQTKSD